MCVFDGKLIDAGDGVYSWDGSVWQQLGGEFAAPSDSKILAVQEFNGALYAAGGFTSIAGNPVKFLAKWDGQAWSPVSGSPDGVITTLAARNKLYMGGSFSTAGGLIVNSVTAWDGTNWDRFGNGITNDSVQAIAVSEDGLLAVGGRFLNLDGEAAFGIGIWRNDHWIRPNAESNGGASITSMLWRGHDLYVTGNWLRVGGVESQSLAIWHEPGAMLEARQGTTSHRFNVEVTGASPRNFTIARSMDFQHWTPVFTNSIVRPFPRLTEESPQGSAGFYRIQSLAP
jgi:hypothetical protein